MENCPNCGVPMEEGHMCAPAEEAPTETAAPEMEAGEDMPAAE